MSGPTFPCRLSAATLPPSAAPLLRGRTEPAARAAGSRARWLARVAGLVTGLVLAVAIGAGLLAPQALAREQAPSRQAGIADVDLDSLPVQVARTLELIKAGGPFPYRKDGTVFGNRERLLPARARGHYTEYTVPTPRARNRGARRIVAAGEPTRSDEFYYTDDHYQSFRRIREPG